MYKDPGKSSATDVREEFQLKKKKAIPTSNTVGMRKKTEIRLQSLTTRS